MDDKVKLSKMSASCTDKLVISSRKIIRVGFFGFHSVAGFVVVTSVIAVFYLMAMGDNQPLVQEKKMIPRCDLFTGQWVYDNKSYPLYEEKRCSFMEDDFACQKYGRNDLDYQHWRWQPRDCDLPRFNATSFMEKLRGKKLVFVGDSLNRNQWISMLCLIEPSISPSTSKSFIWKGNAIIFDATDYNATMEFYWSPLLVESNCDDIVNHRVENRIVRVKAIEKHARQWTDADVLIFDSFIWWIVPKMTFLWGSFESSDAMYEQVENKLRRYEMALNTWSDWLEFHINTSRTKLFFISISPFHNLGEDWGMDKGRNCYNETGPILNDGYWGSVTDRGMMQIVESVIHELENRGLKVEYINITQLSEYRKDAHPSVYRKFWMNLSEEQLQNPESYSDCVHWCLPGVPDVWNVILHSYMMHSI